MEELRSLTSNQNVQIDYRRMTKQASDSRRPQKAKPRRTKVGSEIENCVVHQPN